MADDGLGPCASTDPTHTLDHETIAVLLAECERHRRANLVRTVIHGWNEDIDGSLTDYINEHGWDAVPWKIAASLSVSKEPTA